MTAIERMPDAVRRGCASARQPDVALVAGRCLELRRRARRRQVARSASGEGLTAIGADVEDAVGECVELQRIHTACPPGPQLHTTRLPLAAAATVPPDAPEGCVAPGVHVCPPSPENAMFSPLLLPVPTRTMKLGLSSA